jgi:hypothetical protein
VFPPFLFQISDDKPSTEARQKEGSTEIRPDELMTSWVYDEKFLIGMQFLSRMLPFTTGEEQEERSTTPIDFPRILKNLAATFLVAVKQPATTNLIDSPARPPIATPSTTTQSCGLALGEIRTMKPKESTWSSVAIGKRSISLASRQ